MTYQSKNRKTSQTFHALDWLAQLTTHIPNKREQMVRYYGYYSNKSRGLRKKAGKDDDIPSVINPGVSSRKSRKNGARLIQKIYEIDPLVCPKCQGEIRILRGESGKTLYLGPGLFPVAIRQGNRNVYPQVRPAEELGTE